VQVLEVLEDQTSTTSTTSTNLHYLLMRAVVLVDVCRAEVRIF
jgi:hypothetical protein